MQIIPEPVDLLPWIASFAAGLALGLLFFGGLWWTVRRLPELNSPARIASLTIGSFAVRTGVALLGFYLIMDGQWQRLALAVLGFFTVRLWLVRRFGPASLATPAKRENDPCR